MVHLICLLRATSQFSLLTQVKKPSMFHQAHAEAKKSCACFGKSLMFCDVVTGDEFGVLQFVRLLVVKLDAANYM